MIDTINTYTELYNDKGIYTEQHFRCHDYHIVIMLIYRVSGGKKVLSTILIIDSLLSHDWYIIIAISELNCKPWYKRCIHCLLSQTEAQFIYVFLYSGLHSKVTSQNYSVLFLSIIVLSVLRFMDSDCLFDIFKLFFLLKPRRLKMSLVDLNITTCHLDDFYFQNFESDKQRCTTTMQKI
jgi:hypothetical protein